MAALTQSAIEGLLGLLTTAIKDEARLIGGVPGDIKFIKDEMDSMNGFLLHLNKMESEHDDQVRAWMKQVREVAYIAEDCVERYVRDMARHGVDRGGGCAGDLAVARLFLLHPRTYCQLRKLGRQITELKARVHEVGERRLRYDVKVPAGGDLKRVGNRLPSPEEEERREAFVHSLEGEGGGGGSDDIIAKLPATLRLVPSEADTIRGILERCSSPPEEGDGAVVAFRCTKKMFLCALYVYPYPTNAELKKLEEGVKAAGVGAREARNQVMVFCYSLLSTQQKSCLQYLTAFLHESEISRTSMVRRWVAEGLVGHEPGGGRTTSTPEEAGERCFRELLLRGFVRPVRWSDAGGTVKSCRMDDPVSEFVDGITRSENFVAELPAHLHRQLDIRRIVGVGVGVGGRFPSRRPSLDDRRRMDMLLRVVHCCCCTGGGTDAASEAKEPMDQLVDFIKTFPELYRLNVLDLGGCTGLRSHHLQSFGKVDCLRYLSLRNTDVSRLPAHHIKDLTLLETLDIRGTNIRPRDTKRMYLPKLKHLLAGRFTTTTTTTTAGAAGDATAARTPPSLITVHMPSKIGLMRHMETLSHVQVSMGGAELQGLTKLRQLRKLGVVVHANDAATATLLGRVLPVLAECLRSLSIWVTDAVAHSPTTNQQGGGGGEGIFNISSEHDVALVVLENLDIRGKMSLPSWIGRAPKLANVTLRDTETDGGDALRSLATVQSLRCLKLTRKAFTEQALRFKNVRFQALRFLVVEGDAIIQVAFLAADAAPKLEKIIWAIGGGSRIIAQMHSDELIVGIDNLPSLKVIELRARFEMNNLVEWKKQQEANSAGTPNPRYHVRFISSSSAGNEIVVARTASTLSLPAGVIN